MNNLKNLYKEVTNKMLEELANGVIPWHKPWTDGGNLAVSHVTGNAYSFLNQILISGNGGSTGEYLTFRQALAEGGKVRKGEHGKLIVFFKPQKSTKEMDENDDTEPAEKKKSIPVLKSYFVFEVSQCDGIKRKFDSQRTNPDIVPIERAEKVATDYLDREHIDLFKNSTNGAFYLPKSDEVHIPDMNTFSEIEEYYSTLFHELTHSTGAPHRLSREFGKRFGDQPYSREELVAEMGAAYLCNACAVSSEKAFKNSASYIQGWMDALQQDDHLIIYAASKAQKAADFILGTYTPTI